MKIRNFIILLAFAIACDSPTENAGQENFIESIKFEPGTVFTYSYSFEETDSTFTEVVEIIEQGTIEISIHEADRVPDGPEATFKTEMKFTHSDEFSETWFHVTDDRLLEVAHRNADLAPLVLPKASTLSTDPAAGFLSFHSKILQLAAGNTNFYERKKTGSKADEENEIRNQVVIREDPRVVYQFPLEEGSEWISFETPFLQTRRVDQMIFGSESESREKTAVIHTESPRLDLERWIEIVNPEGLQERILEYTLDGTDETGTFRRKVYLRESYQLEDMN